MFACLIQCKFYQVLIKKEHQKYRKKPKKPKKRLKLRSTKICKKRPLATSEMLSQTLIAARSHPSFQNLKMTTQTQRTKNPKNKLLVTFEDRNFTKNENLVAKNNTIRKLNQARYFSVKKIPGPTIVCSTKERQSHHRTQKLVKIKKQEHNLYFI